MPVYLKEKHDCGIVRTDDTEVGLMLATIEGKPAYRTSTERYLKNQYYSGAPDYAALDPQSELPIIMDDFRSGFGLEVADSADPKRYFSSIGMDLRHRGMAIAGPTPTTVTKPDTLAALTIGNKDMEADGTWDAGDRSATHAYSGTYGWLVNDDTASQEAATWDDAWRSKTFTFSAWVWTADVGAGTVRIYDGKSTSASTGYGSGSAWKFISVTKTLASDATKLRVDLYVGKSADVWFDDAQLQGPGTGTTVAWKDYDDELYMVSGQTVSLLNVGGTGFSQAFGLGAVATDLEPFTDDALYVPIGTSDSYWEITYATSASLLAEPLDDSETDVDVDDGSHFAVGNIMKVDSEYMFISVIATHTLTVIRGYCGSAAVSHDDDSPIITYSIARNNLDDNKMQFMETVHTDADTMYGNDAVNKTRNTVDPAVDGTAWSDPQTTVGASYHNITSLIDRSGALYILKEDMPYYLDSSGNPQNDLAPELVSLTASTSGKNAYVHKNKLYIPCGAQGLLETDGTTNTFLNPARYCTNLSDFVGRVEAVAGDEEWLYIAVLSGYTNLLSNGNFEAGDPPTGWDAFSCTAAQEATIIKVGSKSMKIHTASANNPNVLQLDVSDYTKYKGKEVTLGFWYYCPSANAKPQHGRIGDGVDDAYSLALTQDDAWHWTTITHTVNAGASRVRTYFYLGLDAEWDASDILYVDGATLVEGDYVPEPENIKILAGREETVDGTTSWVWHPIADMMLDGVETIHISSVYQKRLWIASTTTSDPLYYIPLPVGYGDMLSDANRLFLTGAYFTTPWLHGGFKGEDKAWIKATLAMGHPYNTGRYFAVDYQTLEGSELTVGNFTGSSTSMVQSRYIDVANAPVSTMARFKITAVTDNTDYTPMLRSLDIRTILKPTHRKIIECAIRCSDGILDRDGLPLEETSAAYIRAVLDEARDATWPFTFYDPWGASHTCIILPNDPESVMMTDLKNENPEQYFYIKMQEVALA